MLYLKDACRLVECRMANIDAFFCACRYVCSYVVLQLISTRCSVELWMDITRIWSIVGMIFDWRNELEESSYR